MNILKLCGLCKLSKFEEVKDELDDMSAYATMLEIQAKKSGVNIVGRDESHYDKTFDGPLFIVGDGARLVRCACECLVTRPGVQGMWIELMRGLPRNSVNVSAPDLDAELDKLLNPDRIEIINPIHLNRDDYRGGISIRTPKTQWAEGETIVSADPLYVWRCDEAGSPGIWHRYRVGEEGKLVMAHPK